MEQGEHRKRNQGDDHVGGHHGQQDGDLGARSTESAQPRSGGRRRGRRPGPAAVCPVCGGSFRPARSTQVYCGPECRGRAARAARSRAALLLPAAGACRVIARMHVPDTAGRCCECARPWPCETYRIAAKMAC